MNAPAWLRAQLRSHNQHAFGLALLSLASAALAWILAYFFFALVLLGFYTSIRGDIGTEIPFWIPDSALALAFVLLVWGWLDHRRRRYAGVSDRTIIGWHLIADLLLLPVRMTYAVWGNFSAIRRLSHAELDRAWELLVSIQQNGKGYLSALSLIEPDADALYRLVSTLQMLDLIDLHRGEGDWFYTVRSTHLDEVGKLLASSG